MHALPEQLGVFAEALRRGPDAAFLAQLHEAPQVALRRFDAYRRNVFGNWRAALRSTYPVLAALLGDAAFEALSARYLADFPSEDGDLNHYGRYFSDALASTLWSQSLPYLNDIAKLEWALQTAYFAADPQTFDFTALAMIPAERQASIRLQVWEGATLIESPYPVAAIWQAHQNQERDAALAAINLAPSDYALLALRDSSGNPDVLPLNAGDAVFYRACQQRQSLPQAIASAMAADPQFSLDHCLGILLERQLITGFTDTDQESP